MTSTYKARMNIIALMTAAVLGVIAAGFFVVLYLGGAL